MMSFATTSSSVIIPHHLSSSRAASARHSSSFRTSGGAERRGGARMPIPRIEDRDVGAAGVRPPSPPQTVNKRQHPSAFVNIGVNIAYPHDVNGC
jgi:hypothetical protein